MLNIQADSVSYRIAHMLIILLLLSINVSHSLENILKVLIVLDDYASRNYVLALDHRIGIFSPYFSLALNCEKCSTDLVINEMIKC